MLVLKKGVVACFLKEWPVWRFSKKKSRLHSTDFLDWVVRLHLDDDDSSVCPCHDRKKRFGRRPPRSSPNHPKSSYAAAFDEFVSCDVKAISISQASNSCVIKNTKHLQAFPLGMKSSSRQFFSLSWLYNFPRISLHFDFSTSFFKYKTNFSRLFGGGVCDQTLLYWPVINATFFIWSHISLGKWNIENTLTFNGKTNLDNTLVDTNNSWPPLALQPLLTHLRFFRT